MPRYRVTVAEWDCESGGVAVDLSDLPTVFSVDAEDEDEALDSVSDSTGWCIISATVERVDADSKAGG